MSLYRFSALDDAIDRANDTRYGLNASVWTKSVRTGREVGARLHAGTVNVNEGYAAAWGSVDAPMGGVGESGVGRRHGAEGLLKYTEAKTLARQRLANIGPVGPMGHSTYTKTMTVALTALRRIGWR